MISNNEVNATKIIFESRLQKSVVIFALAEIFFVTSSTDLNESEKIIWFIIAGHCANHPQLSCCLSYQEIALLSAKNVEDTCHAIKKLNQYGYLNVTFSYEAQFRATLTLPHPGLLRLKKAPHSFQNSLINILLTMFKYFAEPETSSLAKQLTFLLNQYADYTSNPFPPKDCNHRKISETERIKSIINKISSSIFSFMRNAKSRNNHQKVRDFK